MKRKSLNQMKMQLPSKSANEAFVRSAVAAFAAQLDPTVDEIGDIKTAVSEAVTNCIVHAYRDRIGDIFITCEVLEGQIIRVRIRDTGCGIADVRQAMEPMYTTGDRSERAGLGFAVMESFMDRVRVTSRPGKGTIVTMEKQIRSRGQDEGTASC